MEPSAPLRPRRDPKLAGRLKRALNHLATIIHMVESDRDALDAAQQLQVVVEVLNKVRAGLAAEDLDHVLSAVAQHLSEAERDQVCRLRAIARQL